MNKPVVIKVWSNRKNINPLPPAISLACVLCYVYSKPFHKHINFLPQININWHLMHTLPLMVQVSLLLAYHLHHQNQSERKCLSKICQICWSASHLCGFLFSLIININDDFVPFKSRLLIMCLLNQNCEMFTKYVNHEVMLRYFCDREHESLFHTVLQL